MTSGPLSSETGADAGFTLLEAIVAFAILAATVAAFHQGLGAGWRGIAAASGENEAVAIGQSRLAAAGFANPLAEGTTTGSEPGGFDWTLEQARYTGTEDRTSRPLYRVLARVSWRDAAGHRREITLETLKLAERPAQ